MGQGAAGRALQIPRKDASETHSVYLGATIHAIGTALQSFSSLEALEAEEHSELCVLVILDLLLLAADLRRSALLRDPDVRRAHGVHLGKP